MYRQAFLSTKKVWTSWYLYYTQAANINIKIFLVCSSHPHTLLNTLTHSFTHTHTHTHTHTQTHEESELKLRLQEVNHILLKNILPEHVANHFIQHGQSGGEVGTVQCTLYPSHIVYLVVKGLIYEYTKELIETGNSVLNNRGILFEGCPL